MGYVGVSICDMCGKRTEKFAGRLRLFQDIIHQRGYSTQSTVRSWRVCKRCFNKLNASETIGDKIKEEIELKLDQVRVKNNDILLLK